LRATIEGPSVWQASDVVGLEALHESLDDAALALEPAALAALGERIGHKLEHGVGVVRLGGVPVNRLQEAELETFLLALSRSVGEPVSQSVEGNLLFRVADAGLADDDKRARGPNSRKALTFHSDRCDVIGFLCVRQAAEGGESVSVSAGAIHNEILRRAPRLLDVLYEPFYWDRHNIDTTNRHPWYRMPVFASVEGRFAVTLMQVLIDRAHRREDLPDLTDDQQRALGLVQELAADPRFQLRFRQRPGELLFINNYVTLHSRTEFSDPPGTPGRLLLRVWLSVKDSRPLHPSWAAHYGAVGAGELRGGIRPA
jgi:hypothetical protein